MVEIGEFSTTVRVGEGEFIFSPQVRDHIRELAVSAVREYMEHQERVCAEQRLTSGVRDEQEGEA